MTRSSDERRRVKLMLDIGLEGPEWGAKVALQILASVIAECPQSTWREQVDAISHDVMLLAEQAKELVK